MYANTEHTTLTMHGYLLDIYFDQFSNPSRPCIMYVWWSSAQHNEEILFFRAMAMHGSKHHSQCPVSSIKNSKLSLIFAKKNMF